MNPIFFESPSELRDWLEENHGTAQELWVGFYKKGAAKTGITYKEALDEALCYGWIDGVRKSVDEDRYTNRFSPRKPKSNWSAVNIKRVGELKALGRMKPSGLREFERRDPSRDYSYETNVRELDAALEKQFRANRKAWDFFDSQPPSYQRLARFWIMSAKKEETRLKRLQSLIESSERGTRLPGVTGKASPAKP